MDVNHYRQGEGDPLLLIHGIGHRWQAWLPVLDRLAERHDVIAIDLPGFGQSPVPAGGMPRDMADVVAAMGRFLDRQGVDRPHVAGYSLGGAIGLEMAAAGLTASATVFSPAGFFTPAERRRALANLHTMRMSTFLPAPMIRAWLERPALLRFSYGRLVAYPDRIAVEVAVEDALNMRRGKGFRPVARASVGYRYEGVPDCPVTVGWGVRDRIFGVHQAGRARLRLPAARHVALPSCGHVPMSDDPDAVVDLILSTTGAALRA